MDLFPGVLSRPITVRDAWEGVDTDDKNLKLTRLYTKYWKETKQGGSLGKLKTTKRLAENRPAFTMVKSEGNGGLYHPTTPRMLSYTEFKRISSYPDEYCKNGTRKNWQERLGNSVPPLLMKAIATQIRCKLWNGDPLTRYPKTMTYPEILDAAWQDHLAPRDPDAPTIISTFAGGGGSSLGYSMAGYRELLAVEWDNNAVETFKLNFPDVSVYHGDIAKLSVEECMRLAGLSEPGELDLLDGSPPCQSFSTAGKRDMNDPRSQLFREFVRLLRGLKPKVFVMENVPGLVKGKMKLIFAEIMRELKASGYQVRCKKLNAMYFYVPQSRERLIFIGVRNDLGVKESFPRAESRPVTLQNAIEDVQALVLYPHGKYSGHIVNATTESCPTLCKTGLLSYKYEVYEVGQKPPKASDLKKQRWGNTKRGQNHKERFSLSRLAWDKPSVTIQKTVTGSTGLMHPDQPRELYECELKRIGSYPHNYCFSGKWSDILNRIGNSVPPLFMRFIAEHIKAHCLTT